MPEEGAYNHPMEKPDGEIIYAYRAGDRTAFDELVKRYIHRIYAFAYRLSKSETIAEDAAQETFVKAWKGLKSFDESKSFQAWLFAIARNAVIDIMRKKRDSPFSLITGDDSFESDLEDDLPLPDQVFEQALTHEVLEKTLDTLSYDQKSVVLLHDMEGMTFEEIGEALGRPMNTVKSHYRRAILSLREALKGKL
jgi:RNA polymerase sigma-70 factor (ECF subfamily)